MDLTKPNSLVEKRFAVVNDRARDVTLRSDALEFIRSSFGTYDLGEYVQVYAGAVYDRKGYPDVGSVSKRMDKSPYSGNDRHYVIRAEIIVPGYMLDASANALLERIADGEEITERERIEALRQENLDKAAALRAEAEKLEERAKELEQRQ